MAKSSLEKSHSKASNFKLTLICMLAAISFNAIFGGLALININKIIGIIVAISGGILFIFSYLLISKFTR